jgi:hypothetical protein
VLTPAQVQTIRAVEVLERIGSPAARELLTALAASAPADLLTREASAALERLKVLSATP